MASLSSSPDFISPKQTLELLKMHGYCRSMATFRKWWRNGLFPSPIYSPTGRALYFRKADVYSWLKSHGDDEGE